MARKINFNNSGIEKLPNDKPVIYRIQTKTGKDNHVGIAQRGRTQERLKEHLGSIPGAKVVVEQFGSINGARAKEKNIIKRSQPKYNKQDK